VLSRTVRGYERFTDIRAVVCMVQIFRGKVAWSSDAGGERVYFYEVALHFRVMTEFIGDFSTGEEVTGFKDGVPSR